MCSSPPVIIERNKEPDTPVPEPAPAPWKDKPETFSTNEKPQHATQGTEGRTTTGKKKQSKSKATQKKTDRSSLRIKRPDAAKTRGSPGVNLPT